MAVDGITRLWPLAEAAGHISLRAGRVIQPVELIALGAECRLDVFWRNSNQEFSALIGFGNKVETRERSLRHLRLTSHDLGRLEVDEQITTSSFEPTTEDDRHLAEVGSTDGMRATGNRVTVTRAQLFIRPEDVDRVAELFPALIASTTVSNDSKPDKPKSHESKRELRERVILEAIAKLGLDPLSLPKGASGKVGVKSQIKKTAFEINKAAFGPNDPDNGYNNTWDPMQKAGDLKYGSRPT